MKIAFLYCQTTQHPCGGATECIRMFNNREAEFSVYDKEAEIASVAVCDYCQNGSVSMEKTIAVLQKHQISHLHLAACITICPCGNFESIHDFWTKHSFLVQHLQE